MSKVVILQEYIPSYRVPFFELLHELAASEGIEIVLASGEASLKQSSRRDSASLDFAKSVFQHEWNFLGRRVVFRDIRNVIVDADLIIVEQARRNIDAYRVLLPKFLKKNKIAFWGHGRDFTKATHPFDRQVNQQLTAKADWFFAYTSGGVSAVTKFGYPSSRTTVVQNSIDTTALKNDVARIDAQSVARFSDEHGLRGKTALFLGALDESKRLSFLVSASELAHRLDPEFRILIAGEGVLRKKVEAWAQKHEWLIYLGPLSGDSKAIALASSQVIAMPGRVGLVAVDSFAAAIPIITTDWEWHAPEFEYLEPGVNAVVTFNEENAFAFEIIQILRSPVELDRLKYACEQASFIYTVDAMSKNFLHGIQQALRC